MIFCISKPILVRTLNCNIFVLGQCKFGENCKFSHMNPEFLKSLVKSEGKKGKLQAGQSWGMGGCSHGTLLPLCYVEGIPF